MAGHVCLLSKKGDMVLMCRGQVIATVVNDGNIQIDECPVCKESVETSGKFPNKEIKELDRRLIHG